MVSKPAKIQALEDVRQHLVELIADFLDSDEMELIEILNNFGNPEPREETELHIRMANAAFSEYFNTIVNKD